MDDSSPDARTSAAEASGTSTNDMPSEFLADKRVAFVVNSDSGGGVEHLAKTMIEDLTRWGAKPQSIFLYPDAAANKYRKLSGTMSAILRVVAARPDMIVTFQPTSSVAGMVAGSLIGCRARVAHQSNMPDMTHPVPRYLDRIAGTWGFYTSIIINSTATHTAFSGYPEAYRRRFRRIPHGVVWQNSRLGREAARAALGIAPDVPVLVTSARLTPQKSHETIISALPSLPDTLFLVIGDGPHADNLTRLAAELGVQDRVRLLGYMPQQRLFDIYPAADVFVFPSVWETFGLAAVEAAAAGLPIVASNIPPSREVLTIDGESAATFVEDWSTAAWTEALRQAIAAPARKEHAAAFAAKIRKQHGIERMLHAYHKLYRELLA